VATKSADISEVGVIGLGSMGTNVALKLKSSGYSLVLYNRESVHDRYAPFKIEGKPKPGIYLSENLTDFVAKLKLIDFARLKRDEKPSVVWMMVPGGKETKDVVRDLSRLLRSGDIVIDASNSLYKDSMENYALLKTGGIHYLDVGFAAGPMDLVVKGASLMVGGNEDAFEYARNLFSKVAGKEGSFGYVGPSGSGHMAKLVHNRIFYKMLAACAEDVEFMYKIAPAGFNAAEALWLLSRSPPITTDIMEAIAHAHDKKAFPAVAPDIPLSAMVAWGRSEAERLGVSQETDRVLYSYPSLSETSRRIIAAAKKIVTGH